MSLKRGKSDHLALINAKKKTGANEEGEDEVGGRNPSSQNGNTTTVYHTMLFPTFRYLGMDASRG